MFRAPRHPYTRALLSVVPDRDPCKAGTPQILTGEAPDPANVPSGCRFRTRCPVAEAQCATADPHLRFPSDATSPAHEVACHLA